MYHHWQMQKRADPCGEMGGFTRLLTTRSGNDEGGAYQDEIPTFHVKELSGGMGLGGYVVVNRPWSMLQWAARRLQRARAGCSPRGPPLLH